MIDSTGDTTSLVRKELVFSLARTHSDASETK